MDKNIWIEISELLLQDQIEKILELIEEWVEIGNPSIWQWNILVDDYDIFPQEAVNYLLQLTRNQKGMSESGEMFIINPNIRTVAREVFNFIATVTGPEVIKAFDRAFEALKEDPSLTYEYWLNYRIQLGFNSELEDSIIHAVSSKEVYSLEPLYLVRGYADVGMIAKGATIQSPIVQGESVKLYRRNLHKYSILQTQKRLKLEDSIELFRMLGPVNRAVNVNLTSDHKCSIYGGCRMLLCDCYDKDWFKGFCEVCLRKIRYPNWALRMPIFTGSWKGCFCSPGCLEYKINRYGGPMDQLIFINTWNQIKEKGIYHLDELTLN